MANIVLFYQSPTEHDDDESDVPTFQAWAYVICFLVPVMSALISIVTRQLKHIDSSVLMLWFGFGALVVSVGGILSSGEPVIDLHTTMDAKTVTGVLAIGSLGIAGNVLYTVAMKYVSPSKANVFRSFEVILNYVLQVTIEHMAFHGVSVVGIGCLLVAVAATGFESEAMRKWRPRFPFL